MKKEQKNCEQSSFISNKYSLKSKKKKATTIKRKKKGCGMWEIDEKDWQNVEQYLMDVWTYSTIPLL